MELSRPQGNLSRWEKVFHRLALLNKYYPMNKGGVKCKSVRTKAVSVEILNQTKDVLVELDAVFFGGFTNSVFAPFLSSGKKRMMETYSDFEVLYEDPLRGAHLLLERLEPLNLDLKIVDGFDGILPDRVEVRLSKELLVTFYKPLSCHNYNLVQVESQQSIRVATIDTILSFYLAFMFTRRNEDRNRYVCTGRFLYELLNDRQRANDDVLQRFTPLCYGKQETPESIRARKAAKFSELKLQPHLSREYQEWFLYYNPERKTRRRKSGTHKTSRKK
jgi:hypothetical protein